jgi:hypothetical protein
VFVTPWAIWHARRKALHEQIYQSPFSTHFFVKIFIADLKSIEERAKKTLPAVERDVMHDILIGV